MEDEKQERRNKLFEEFKASPQYKAFQESFQNRIKAITEKSLLSTDAIQARLEPIQREVEQLLTVVKQAFLYVQEKLDENEIRFNDAKELYKRLEGKAPIPYVDFWDWFFSVEHGESDKTLAEVAERLRFISTIDVKKATEWFEDEYRKKNQPQQLPKGQKPTPQPFGPELVEVVKKALGKRGLLEEGKFTGKPYQVKALYNVLKDRDYILGIEYPEKRFASWFLENFEFRITDRSLRNPPSRGQITEEGRLKLLIK